MSGAGRSGIERSMAADGREGPDAEAGPGQATAANDAARIAIGNVEPNMDAPGQDGDGQRGRASPAAFIMPHTRRVAPGAGPR